MGQSTNAMLVYGYNLGGDDGWELEGCGEYGEMPALDWYNPDDPDGDDFQAAAERRLLAEIAGFTEEWSRENEGYFDRERAAKAQLGVEFDTHCSGECPMYLLATKVITVYRGGAKPLDLVALDAEAAAKGWNATLEAATRALGITPKTGPGWILCSYWG
jgi:hypothetical protein